ncbi:MAG: DUF1127 domain-containing protein [Pseudomonadota bacterium]
MSTFSQVADTVGPTHIWASVTSFIHSIRTAIALNAEADVRLAEMRRLQACSNETLAELGVQRDDIVRHVFRDLYT